MKKLIILAVFIAFITGLKAQTTFNDGLSKAKTSKKLVLVNIFSVNDKWSQKMDEVYNNQSVKNLIDNNFIYVRLNSEGSEKYTYNGKDYTAYSLARLFGGTGFPSHIILGTDGNMIKYLYLGEYITTFSGYLDENEFQKFLSYFAEGKYKDSDLSKYF